MSDRLIVEGGKAMLQTAEGATFELSEDGIIEMIKRQVQPPTHGVAYADGVKFCDWQPPYMIVVHQTPPHVRRLRWIAADSPAPYGSKTKYRNVRISLPYLITIATFIQHGEQLVLTGANELYFRNEPLRAKSDRLGYPALLNISQVRSKTRERTWICIQYLSLDKCATWTEQLDRLLEHTLNGGFNLSSEHHEGASYYGVSKGIHPDLHPIERWEKATLKDERFVLHVPWIQAKHSVGELIEHMFNEQLERKDVGVRQRASAPVKIGLVSQLLNDAQRSTQETP